MNTSFEHSTPEADLASSSFTPVGSAAERVFLDGPHSRRTELRFLFRVLKQFLYGLRKLHFVGPCITVFGSARFGPDHPYYALARQLGAEMAGLGFTVMTGGGPGIMEAANRGAQESGGRSIGCNIRLPKEQAPNAYLYRWITLDYFFVRKTLLSKYSYGFHRHARRLRHPGRVLRGDHTHPDRQIPALSDRADGP